MFSYVGGELHSAVVGLLFDLAGLLGMPDLEVTRLLFRGGGGGGIFFVFAPPPNLAYQVVPPSQKVVLTARNAIPRPRTRTFTNSPLLVAQRRLTHNPTSLNRP